MVLTDDESYRRPGLLQFSWDAMRNQVTSVPKSNLSRLVDRDRQDQSISPKGKAALDESVFKQMLALERKRSDRSGRHFGLLCLRVDRSRFNGTAIKIVDSVARVVRETDVVGWYQQDAVLGVILTELGSVDGKTADIILEKIGGAVRTVLESSGAEGVEASIDFYPGDLEGSETISKRVLNFCPDLNGHSQHSRTALFLKRMLDFFGSAFMLACLSPVLVVISTAVKLTSKGPILFRQERIGQFGETFTFLKFRTMYVDTDHSLHEDYIDGFIKNGNGDSDALKRDGVYKLSGDPRVTRVGRILRKTSLDELPQFWNVVRGEMSLVGPRPPIPYELKRYSTWHKKRILEAKPGITGLWQVEGRSQTTFDDMVRLDLQYAQNWSLRQDISLLLRTPLAVIKGNGAC